MNWLKAWWHRLVTYYRAGGNGGAPKPAPEPPPPRPEPPPPIPPFEPPPPPPRSKPPQPQPEGGQDEEIKKPTDVRPNRLTRRRLDAYERARRKQDKWVIPQGQAPEPIHHHEPREVAAEQEETSAPPATPIHDAERAIIDKINDVDEDVLIKESEFWGQYNFRDSILDQLERYWVYLERMKKHDAQSYGFYKQVGATLVPNVMTNTHTKERDASIEKMTAKEIIEYKKSITLPAWFRLKRPAFGCVAYGAHSMGEKTEDFNTGIIKADKRKSDLWVPKFVYFIKYHRPPPEIQPMAGGDIYRMTVWWDKPQSKKYKWGRPTEFAVFVSADAKDIVILKKCDTKLIRIHQRHRHKAGHEYFSIPQREWRIPDDYEQWSKSFGLDVQTHLSHLFCSCIKMQEYANFGMVRIAVHKDDMTAVFSVDMRRIAYFFKDRDFVLNAAGHRRKIFHIVRAHTRKDGTPIKMRFQGEKEFTWAGYNVEITVPGKDHIMLNEIALGYDDGYWWEGKMDDDHMDEPACGEFIVEEIIRGGKYR